MGFIKTFLSGVGVNGALLIGGILLPILLSFIKVGKYGSILDNIMLGVGISISVFLRGKLGKALEKIIEWFIITIIVKIVIYPLLAGIKGLRRDNKNTLEVQIKTIKDAFKQMLKKQ